MFCAAYPVAFVGWASEAYVIGEWWA